MLSNASNQSVWECLGVTGYIKNSSAPRWRTALKSPSSYAAQHLDSMLYAAQLHIAFP